MLVPAVDEDGNEVAGVRAPMVGAPLATYTGWNLRARHHGEGAMHEFTGSTLPFPDSEAERRMTGDPRRSIAARYADQAGYAAAIGAAARALVAARLMLVEGRVQKSPDGVIHLMATKVIDRSAELDRLWDARAPDRSVAAPTDTAVVRSGAPASRARHPRDARILPKSRDFH